MNVVCAAGGLNEDGRICRAAAKRVTSARIRSKHRRIFVQPNLCAPFESMRVVRVGQLVLDLIDAAVRTKDRAICRVERLKQPVPKAQSDISMIRSRKNRRASNESERYGETEIRCNRARVANCGASLVIKEIYAECRVDCRLVRVGRRPANLIETKSSE